MTNYPKIGSNDGLPVEERLVYSMMIHREDFTLLTEFDSNSGEAVGFVRDSAEPGQWDTVEIIELLTLGWIPLEFETPMPFGEAIDIANEYRMKTEEFDRDVLKYKRYINDLQMKAKRV